MAMATFCVIGRLLFNNMKSDGEPVAVVQGDTSWTWLLATVPVSPFGVVL